MTNRWFYYYAESTDGVYKWTSGSWGWKVDTTAHNQCRGTGISCTTNGHNPPYDLCFGERWLFHREKQGTATDYTLNLTN